MDHIDLAGYRIEVWLDDKIDFMIWLYGYYEIHESRMFLSLLKPGDRVVDIGANIGYYSLLAASRIGRTGKIFAFEPVPSTFWRLCHNVRDIPWVEPIQYACGDKNGPVEMYISDFRHTGQSGSSRIIQPLPNSPQIKAGVQCVRLDHFLRERNIARIDVVKIDTEGYELKVLHGMENTIENNHDIKILTEVNEKYIRMSGSTPKDFFNYLKAYGLRPWHLTYTEANRWTFKEDNGFKGNRSLLLFSREYPVTMDSKK